MLKGNAGKVAIAARAPGRRHPYAAALLVMSSAPWPALAQSAAPASVPAATSAADAQTAQGGTTQVASSRDVRLSEVKVQGQRETDDYNAGVSTVGAKTPTAIHDLPQTVTVVNRAVLEAQGARSLTDALRNVPGITIGAGEGGQIGNNINLRGFSARTDLYLDGFRDRGQYSRDVFSLESVEVLEGASSLLFGRGATGGIINQVSKRPRRETLGQVDLTIGTDDLYRLTADYGHALGATSAFRVAVMGQNVDATRDIVNNKDYGVAPSIAFGIGTDTQVTASLLSQHNNDIPDYGVPLVRFAGQAAATPLDVPRERYYGYTNDRFKQDVNVFGLNVEHRFSAALQLRSNTQYSQYRTAAAATPLGSLQRYDAATNTYGNLTSTTVPAGTPFEDLLIGVQQRDRAIRDSSLFNQTDLLWTFDTGAVRHHFAAGAEIGRDEYSNDYFGWYNFNYNNGAGLNTSNNPVRGYVDVFNLGAPPEQARPGGDNVYRVPANTTRTNADTLAFYFNDQLDLGAHWKLVGGLRWDQYTAEQDYLAYSYNGLIASNPDPAQADAVAAANAAALQTPTPSSYHSAHNDYHWSTRAGLVWQPDTVQSYYVSYGTSFNPLAEAVSSLPTSAGAEQQYVDGGGFAPEKDESYELGGKWSFAQDALALNAALFQVEKTNARNLDPVTQEYTLDGDIRVQGGEFGIAGRVSPHWQVFGGYTYLYGRIESSPVAGVEGSVQPNTPQNSFSAWTTYDLSRHWQVGGGATYSSKVWLNNTATAYVPAYTRYDMTLAYQRRNWSLRMNLQNLSDELYYQAASGGRATPADGLRALFTFSYHLS